MAERGTHHVEIRNSPGSVEIFSTIKGTENLQETTAEGRFNSFRQAQRRKLLGSMGWRGIELQYIPVALAAVATSFLKVSTDFSTNRYDTLSDIIVMGGCLGISEIAYRISGTAHVERKKLNQQRKALSKAAQEQRGVFRTSFPF
jgi:hypothetical protein